MQTNYTLIFSSDFIYLFFKCIALNGHLSLTCMSFKKYNNSTSLNWFGGLTRSPSLTKSLGSKWFRDPVLAGQL